MKLVLTEQAADQIAAINDYLTERSPLGARNVKISMRETFAYLLQFPRLGRRQKTGGVRKIGVGSYPYNVYYLVDEAAGEVIIVSVRHMARAPDFFDT